MNTENITHIIKRLLISVCILTSIFPPAVYAQGGPNGMPPGVQTLSPTYGDGLTDVTATINAILATTSVGKLIIPAGTYALSGSGIVLPDNKEIECAGYSNTVLSYTGASQALSMTGRATIKGCRITKSGGIAATAIVVSDTGTGGGTIFHNYLTGFSTCALMNGGAASGAYFFVIDNNFLGCTKGVDSAANGSAVVNSITVRDNVIRLWSTGISQCATCKGWLIQRNNIESPPAGGGHMIEILGSGSKVESNWVEYNSGSFAATIGIYASGTHNFFDSNLYPQDDTGSWVNKSIAPGNTVTESYDHSNGAFYDDIRIPGGYLIAVGSLTVAQINSGTVILAAHNDTQIRVIGFELQAIGGNFGTCTAVQIADTAGSPVVAVSVPIATLTANTIVTPSSANITFTTYSWQGQLTANKGLQINKTGGACGTATDLRYDIKYQVNQ